MDNPCIVLSSTTQCKDGDGQNGFSFPEGLTLIEQGRLTPC